MKWIAIAGGVVVALIVLVVMIGSLLPRDHVATVSAVVAAPPAKVWATITRPDSFTSWRSDLTRVELLPSAQNQTSWREHSRNGAMTMVIEDMEPPRHMATRIVDQLSIIVYVIPLRCEQFMESRVDV